jgi:adenylate cyclase
MAETRKLAAILAGDLVGYSRLASADEDRTLARLRALRSDLVDPTIAVHYGRVVKRTGDGILIEFRSVVDAVRCAIEVQNGMIERNAGLPQERRIEFRIGIHLGDVVEESDGDLMGDGVNIAARLEGIADPSGICLSNAAYEQVRDKLKEELIDLGEQNLKNIARPVRAYRVMLNRSAAKSEPALTLPDKPSIAVLPFNNMSGEPDQDYLADGIVEAITGALSRIRSFFVIARNSAFTYKGRAANVRDIGRELGVAYVLEGSMQKVGNRVRIIVQLIETVGGAHVWTGRHDGTIDDIFDLQDRITEHVAGALQPSIRIAEIERSRRKRPQDLGAYDYAMRAMPHVWTLEKEESAKALELLDKALAIDPEYPLALSLAGWCYAQRSVYDWVDDIAQSQARALKLAERAAELSGDDPLILAVLGAVHTFVRNHGTARVLLERAVAIDPNAAWAWSRLGWLDNYADQPERAIEEFERALRLSPLDPMNFNNYLGMGSAHEVAQDYDKAAALYRRGLEERPHATWIYRNLASSLSGAGRMEEAKEAYARMVRSYPDLTASRLRQAMVFSPAFLDRMVDNLRKLGLPD